MRLLYGLASIMPKKFLEACAEYLWYNGTEKLRKQYIEQFNIEKNGIIDARLIQYLGYWNIVNAVTHPKSRQQLVTISDDLYPRFNKSLFWTACSDEDLNILTHMKVATIEDLK